MSPEYITTLLTMYAEVETEAKRAKNFKAAEAWAKERQEFETLLVETHE
jgi:hypothetical protein